MDRQVLSVAALGLTLLTGGQTAAVQAQELVAVERLSGDSYTINPDSGWGWLIASETGGSLPIENMAKQGDVFWIVTGYSLDTFDPATGEVHWFSGLTPPLLPGITASSWLDGTFYLIMATGSDDALWRLEVATGVCTSIGHTGFYDITGMDGANGVLYAWDLNAGLLTVDTATGVATDVNPAVGGAAIETIAFLDGQLYGCYDKLYKINRHTGEFTPVSGGAPLYDDVRGMEGIQTETTYLTISVIPGPCPGLRRFEVSNALPGSQVALFYASCEGASILPTGPCQGAPLDLCANGQQLLQIVQADAQGSGGTYGSVSPAMCAGFVEWLELGTCRSSFAAPVNGM